VAACNPAVARSTHAAPPAPLEPVLSRGQSGAGRIAVPESNIEQSERIGHVSQTEKKKMKKMKKFAEDQFNTPSSTSMSLYHSINTPSYTTRTTNMYNKDVNTPSFLGPCT
jgi:hypothetical protein